MSPLSQAHILAAKLLAHNLEAADMDDIKWGLQLLSIHRSLGEHAEHRYKQYGRTHISASPHPGWVAMVWGGRDCDGVQSEGDVHYVRATITDVLEDIDREHANAEGPVWWHMVSPSKAKAIEHTSRDLTLEAFEDGHSHVLYG